VLERLDIWIGILAGIAGAVFVVSKNRLTNAQAASVEMQNEDVLSRNVKEDLIGDMSNAYEKMMDAQRKLMEDMQRQLEKQSKRITALEERLQAKDNRIDELEKEVKKLKKQIGESKG